MRICIPCKKEMTCLKTGIRVVYGDSHVYAADLFGCPDCGATIANCNRTPYFDPNVLTRTPQEYIYRMN